MQDNPSKCHVKCKLSVCGFTLATAFTSGLGIFILGLVATYLKIGGPYVTLLGSVYKGYEASYQGSLIGGGWAFACGLICGFVFAVIYNLTVRVCCCPSCKPCVKE